MPSLENIRKLGVLPVIKIEDVETSACLAESLLKGGLDAIEVTLRNESALKAIETIKSNFPDMTVGAGTILSPSQIDEAIAAGADFLVSPGFNVNTVEYALNCGYPIVPGCSTATEISQAVEIGLKTIKFFPSEINGGTAALKLFNGPFPNIEFIPTGGLTFDNLESYLRMNCISACGGSFMAGSDLIKAHNWELITTNCKRAVRLSLGFELAHVGINHDNENDALDNAKALQDLLGLSVRNGNSSAFCGTAVEFMKSKYYGLNGHIGFYTNSVYRAKAWFEKNGIPIREDSLKIKADGKYQSFYLRDEIGGFAIHVVAR